MTLAIVFLVFFAFALLGVPLVWALLATTLTVMALLGRDHPIEGILLNYIGGVEPFHLAAVPLFIIAGELISRGGVGRRIVEFARTVFGFLPGGLGIVTVMSCLIFGAVSGSAIAASAAIGTVMIPAMRERGYSAAFAGALVAVAGTLGVIIPPSIPMLVYGFVGGVSVKELFVSGIVPGLLFGVSMMAVCFWYGKTTGCDRGDERLALRNVARAAWRCLPALMMPIIILGGIYSGVFTPTESAAVAVFYGLFVALVLYRELRMRDLPSLLLESLTVSAVVMLIVGATTVLAWLITVEQVPAQLTRLVQDVAASRFAFLLLVNIVLLVLGIFIEPLPAIIIAAPLFVPAARAFGIDPVHLGLIMTCNLAIGLYTPPVGGTLFVAARIANVAMGAMTRALVPLFLSSLVVLLLITYVELLPMGLVWLGRG